MTRLETKNYGDVANKFPEDEQRCGKSRIKCLSWDLYIAYLGEFIGGMGKSPRSAWIFLCVSGLRHQQLQSCWRLGEKERLELLKKDAASVHFF